MNMRIFILTLVMFCTSAAKAAQPLWAWKHNFNANVTAIDYHNDFIYTVGTFSDSAFVFGNASIINNGNYGTDDVVIVKWDTLGNLIWAISIWGADNDAAVGIKVNDDGITVAGHTYSAALNLSGNIFNSNGGTDIYIARYDLNGNYLNASIHGGAGNESALDMCIDYLSNVYIVSNAHLTKYNAAGQQQWQHIVSASEIDYSQFDSTILLSGRYLPSVTIGNHTVNAPIDNDPNAHDIFGAKIGINGTVIWLKNMADTYVNDVDCKIGISNLNGNIFANFISYWPLNGPNEQIRAYTPAGIPFFLNNVGITGRGENKKAMQVVDSFLIVSGAGFDEPPGITVVNLNADGGPPAKDYDLGNYPVQPPSFVYFKSLDAIYTMSNYYVNYNSLGKIGNGSLIGIPSNQNLEVCAGALTTLTGNINGGMGPLTYLWQPATGLNNTNTNSVNFTAVNNISYTLTVTDTAGHVAKDTFNINVNNPLAAVNISSQYPSLCDSMKLYSNNGVAGDWYQFIAANNQWQPLSTDTVITIFAAGIYRYFGSNVCNSIADTISIPGTVTVNANASSDSICAGQSVTLNGSGASTYVWTGGITNNVPFTPLSTQTYVVTGTDANGCSNTSFIQITILSSNDTSALSICQNQVPYSWNGQSLDSSGTYTANFTNAYGCDSVEILNLTVSPCVVCVPEFVINYSPFYNALTESQSWILTSGTVLILSGTNVKLDAHTNSYVSLNPGFIAEHGSVFVAQAYNGCTAGAPQLPHIGKVFKHNPFAVNEIVLYPNPTTGLIHIKHDEKLSSIQIFDMVGKLVINQKCAGETETDIDLSNLPNGVYHVKAVGYNSIKVVKNN